MLCKWKLYSKNSTGIRRHLATVFIVTTVFTEVSESVVLRLEGVSLCYGDVHEQFYRVEMAG